MAGRNLMNIEQVTKAFGERPLLDGVTLGVNAGERIAVVGRNGAGKSTLLHVMAGVEPVDSGRVTIGSDVNLGLVSQAEVVDPDQTVGHYIVPGLDVHEWASNARIREVLTGLLGGFNEALLLRTMGNMSGGERRRVQLARALIADLDVLLLDEPTNHLDVEVVAWLAEYLKAQNKLAVVVVTHDRWFLDALCERTWEVVNGQVDEYDGGYSAFVLAKAERFRQANASEARRQNLMRKELAWLRRGAPARTSKPKFRIDAANELISNEPPPRDAVELLSFAGSRLGNTVFELHDTTLTIGDEAAGNRRDLLDHCEWNIGPGDRIGIIGSNGSGKTSLIRMILGEIEPTKGSVKTGVTVKPAYLSQHLEELNPKWRVLEAVEHVASRVELGKGRELTASQLCERLGFGADAQWTPVSDLSGGERRRLQLTRLLMGGPNVLVLDEPTNDFDVETLTALEDLLDGFAGTLLVISHDRYFLERVCDDFVALYGDTRISSLTGGIDEYLVVRLAHEAVTAQSSATKVTTSASEQRAAAKDIARLERAIVKIDTEERALHARMIESAQDHDALARMNKELHELSAKKAALEDEWLSLSG
ncbi:MAG: ABC-F family ATP-binding cassette domain-containing protein [Actinobacteria bacterium]|nr:ABC-F family ATP-binding cassette domain-containing protein [Actinomycetota bacterium]